MGHAAAVLLAVSALAGQSLVAEGGLLPARSSAGSHAQFDAFGTGMTIGGGSAAGPKAPQAQLLARVELALGREFRLRAERRLAGIEELLGATFAALPKNAHGRIGPESVRYVLERLLRRRRAWVLGGLQGGEGESRLSWISRVLVPQVVQSNSTFLSDCEHSDEDCWVVQELFESRLAKKGADMVDVAVLAAVVEQLVHSDMRGKLKAAYLERGLPLNGTVDVSGADDLIDLSMMSFIRGRNISYWNSGLLNRIQGTIAALYPQWPKTREKMRDLRQTLNSGVEQFGFNDISSVVEEGTDRFGHWNDQDCKVTRNNLLEMEEGVSGRVRLLDFYEAALNKGKYEFTETVDYLREIGALDESDPLVPRVIVSNYVMGPSNCVARTGHYSVCCADECEGLLGGLEAYLQSPQATPAEVIAAMDRLPGPPAPPSGSHREWLYNSLEAVAAQHSSGLVPIHGRLAAQWMHFAYPRHCGYAHAKGKAPAARMTMERWELDTGRRSAGTMKDLRETVRALEEGKTRGTPPFTGMWTTHPEELYAFV